MNLLSQSKDSRTVRLLYVGFAFVTAVLYDLFFWKHEIGLSFPIFVLLYLLGFLSITFLTGQFRQKWALLFLVPIIVLSLDVVFLNNDLVHYVVSKVVFVLTIIFSLIVSLDNPQKHRFSFSNIPLLRSLDLPFTKWNAMYRDLFRSSEDKEKDVYRKIALGVVIAVPLLIIFTALFARADAIFADRITHLLQVQDAPEWLWRIFRTVAFTLFIGSFLYVVLSSEHVLGFKEKNIFKIDKVVVGVVLALVNTLFALFVFIQFKYLFGSTPFIVQNSLVYADYARKGFFELAWVIGLASLMLIVVYRSFAHHGLSKLVAALQVILIAQVGVIAVSALKRMHLYQDAYGFTVLRLYVEWFIYFVLVLLAFTGVSLLARLSFRKFLHVCLVSGTVAFTVVACVNVDGIIARENIRRFVEEKKSLDISYLTGLSVDALPAMKTVFEKQYFDRFSVDELIALSGFFNKQEESLGKFDAWQEFNIGLWRALVVNASRPPSVHAKVHAALILDNEYQKLSGIVHGYSSSYCDDYYSKQLKPYLQNFSQAGCQFITISEMDSKGSPLKQRLAVIGYPMKPAGEQAEPVLKLFALDLKQQLAPLADFVLPNSDPNQFLLSQFLLIGPNAVNDDLLFHHTVYHVAELSQPDRQVYLYTLVKDNPVKYQIVKMRKSRTLEEVEQRFK